MEKTAFQCSGHKWMPAAGPGFQPGPHACASGAAPTLSFTLRGLQGKWCLYTAQLLAKSQQVLRKKKEWLVALTMMDKPCS